MKRICFFLAIVLLISLLTACGKNQPAPAAVTDSAEATEPVQTTAEITEASTTETVTEPETETETAETETAEVETASAPETTEAEETTAETEKPRETKSESKPKETEAPKPTEPKTQPTQPQPTQPAPTQAPTTPPTTAAPTEPPTTAPTQPPTEPPTEPPTTQPAPKNDIAYICNTVNSYIVSKGICCYSNYSGRGYMSGWGVAGDPFTDAECIAHFKADADSYIAEGATYLYCEYLPGDAMIVLWYGSGK